MQAQDTKLDFTGQDIYIGIDVHKKDWKVTIMTERLTHKTFCQPPMVNTLVRYVQKNFPGATYHSVYEAGYFGYGIDSELKQEGVDNIVVHPADIPTTDKEKRQKEDRRDSRKLAKTLRSGELDGIYVPSSANLQDRFLLRIRKTIVRDLSRNKSRVKGYLSFFNIRYPDEFSNPNTHWSNRFIQWLKGISLSESWDSGFSTILNQIDILRQELLMINRRIIHLSKADRYLEDVELLISIPGIGRLTAMLILTEIEDINRFRSNDQFHSYLGLIPQTSSSSDRERVGDITSRQNKHLRSALVESSWICVRKDPALLHKYNKLTKRMKGSKAIIRIAKSLANRIMFVLRNKTRYELNIK
jgi:transposase